jgi:hypothetical protein
VDAVKQHVIYSWGEPIRVEREENDIMCQTMVLALEDAIELNKKDKTIGVLTYTARHLSLERDMAHLKRFYGEPSELHRALYKRGARNFNVNNLTPTKRPVQMY